MHHISKEIEDICKEHSIPFDPTLSEDFIREFKDRVNWDHVSRYQKLSENFIREFKGEVSWFYISEYQKLSENFIKEFKDRVYWDYISMFQKLSEDFIRKFKNRVEWDHISEYQNLSEDFIREFKDEVDWYYISRYQKLSKDFRKEFNITIPNSSWLYTTTKEKLKYIKENTNYEIIDDKYIIAYKSVRDDYCSVINFQYKYDIGKTYRSHCDCNLTDENSFGLSAWTKERAYKYYSKGKILKVQIPISKVGAIVHNNNKIRCFELKVLEEIELDSR
jgi:hypothetical protein